MEKEEIFAQISFNSDGLVPAIAQSDESGDVLMLAWMNRDAIEQTLKEGEMVYWSRSKNRLWKKGETSGQVQKLVSLTIDCDGDTLLARVKQTGVACHTGRKTCFFKEIDGAKKIIINQEPEISPDDLYGKK